MLIAVWRPNKSPIAGLQQWTQKWTVKNLIPSAIQYLVKWTLYLGFAATFTEKEKQAMFSEWGVLTKMLAALGQQIPHYSVVPCSRVMASERRGALVKEIVMVTSISISQTHYRLRTKITCGIADQLPSVFIAFVLTWTK